MNQIGKIAIDIGSTVVKVAHVDASGTIEKQEFWPRDFEGGIARQVERLIDELDFSGYSKKILVCSSANGGLRVGIVSLSQHFSGAVLRNQILAAGANPIFVDDFSHAHGNLKSVDILLLGGGIDCPDADPLRERLEQFEVGQYHFKTMLYAGNMFLSDFVRTRFPAALAIDNPTPNNLRVERDSVFEAVRHAYLDDLVYKEGISELRGNLAIGVRPTPEVTNRGFCRAVFSRSTLELIGASVLIDIGGATTDLHYTVEIVRDDSANRPSSGSSVARYVFTDLGIVLSRDNTSLQLRNHPRLFDFLGTVQDSDVRDVYRLLREDAYDITPALLSYACLFLALDRFAQGNGPGLPSADLRKVSQFVLTGGAAQNLSEEKILSILSLFFSDGAGDPGVVIDRDYRFWVDGITWNDNDWAAGV